MDLREHDRFFAKVRIDTSGCWEWTGGKNKDGYGKFWFRGGCQPSHRVSYLAFRGEIPENEEIHHTCENRGCVNPAHLRSMVHYDHMQVTTGFRGWQSDKTHCKHGHEFTEENTRWAWRTTGAGNRNLRRFCRECHRKRDRACYLKKAAA